MLSDFKSFEAEIKWNFLELSVSKRHDQVTLTLTQRRPVLAGCSENQAFEGAPFLFQNTLNLSVASFISNCTKESGSSETCYSEVLTECCYIAVLLLPLIGIFCISPN